MSKFYVTAVTAAKKSMGQTQLLTAAGAAFADNENDAVESSLKSRPLDDDFTFVGASAAEIVPEILFNALHLLTPVPADRIRCADFDEDFWPLYDKVKPFTLTSAERLFDLYKTVEYVERSKIPGSFIECGVWKGGSSMMMALANMAKGPVSRRIQLFDTFEGMTAAGVNDIDTCGNSAMTQWKEGWIKEPLEDVQRNMASTEYPEKFVEYYKGRVEDTLRDFAADSFAIVRLDTDWYESTKHELEVLWPRLSLGGILIIDDYGCWNGSRKATDEYFADKPVKMTRIDDTCRVIQKTHV